MSKKEEGMMQTRQSSHRVVARLSRAAASALAAAVLLSGIGSARADEVEDAKQLVEKAKLTAEQFQKDEKMDAFRDLAKRARGMLILPQMLPAAFILGASGGSGLFLPRASLRPPLHPP